MATRAHGRTVFLEGASLWVLGPRTGDGRFPKADFHSHHGRLSQAKVNTPTLFERANYVRMLQDYDTH